MKNFTEYLNEQLETLDVNTASSVSTFRDNIENALYERFAPIIVDFLQGVITDAVNSYTAGMEALTAAGRKADPFSFTQVQKRWYAAVRRLATVADLDPSEAFIQYTLNGADLPAKAYDEVRETLRTARAEGWSEYQTKRALSKQLIPKQGNKESWKEDRNKYRNAVVLMARMKATQTTNEETLRRIARAGTTFKKWVAHKDDRTRPTHREANGQTVPLNDAFTVGGYQLQHPGDPKAPIQEIANCRCIMVAARKTSTKGNKKMKRKKRYSLTASVTDLYENDNLAFWQGVLVIEGQQTGDGRMIAPGAITWDTPLPLRYVSEDNGGHDGAQDVGLIQYVERVENGEENEIRAGGIFDLGSPEGREAYRQVSEGIKKGVSVDLDDVVFEVRAPKGKAEDVEVTVKEETPAGEAATTDETVIYDSGAEATTQVTKSARLRAATIVSIPAFKDAKIHVVGDDSDDLNETSIEEPDEDEIEQAAADAENFEPEDDSEDYAKKNWVDEVGGLPNYIRRIANHLIEKGMNESHAIASAVNTVKRWARGGGNVKPKTRAKALKALAEWETKKARAKAHSAATITAGAYLEELEPPMSWFEDPKLETLTALTVTDEGRVYGHLAGWNVCHVAFPDDCVTAPQSESGYKYFHTGALRTAEGVELSVGHLTLGTGHAHPKKGVIAAASHYDNTGTAVADVRAGEDEHGIWIAGAIRDQLNDVDLKTLKASPLSGDWRRVNGNLELVAALAVNTPGFPVPRAFRSHSATMSLVASGIVTDEAIQEANNPISEYGRKAARDKINATAHRVFAADRAKVERALRRLNKKES